MYDSEASRRHYLKYRERIIERHKEYNRAHKIELREYSRNYYAKNRERILQQRKDRGDNLKKPIWVFEVKHNEKVSFD